MESSQALFSLVYSGPLFILGAFWLFFHREEYRRLQLLRMLLDAAVFSVAIARFFGSSIPPSGHALLLTHTIITVNNRYFRLVAVIMLIATAGLKISWHDYTSLASGIVLALLSGAAWIWAGSDRILQSDEG
jgi:hypothetical protein